MKWSPIKGTFVWVLFIEHVNLSIVRGKRTQGQLHNHTNSTCFIEVTKLS
jgi:hypothetical protein